MKVKSVKTVKLCSPEPVYDVVGMPSASNFIVKGKSCDIVSHNCSHGSFTTSVRDFYYVPEGGKVVISYGSDAAHALGQQVFIAIMDEVNFSRSGVKDVNKAKEHMKNLYDTIVARVEGTFRLNGEVYGKVFSVSSKRGDSDFMEQHVQDQLAAGNTHLYVSDKPQWEVLPPSMFSLGRFHIAVGDRHHKGFVVENESPSALAELKEQGYELLEVPIDMKTNFLADFDISLRDLAGISVPGALSFITQEMITQCIGDRNNPFNQDVLEIGTKDSYNIEEFFHMEKVDKSLLRHPMYIHLDLSLNTDATGISGVSATGNKVVTGEDGKKVSQPYFSHMFSIKLRAPRGDKIPYAKITEFICWLRRQGFNIEGISRDQFQSEYMAQLLEAQGFDVDKISLDRTPDGYMAFRSVLLEERIDLLDVQELQNELIYLQRDAVSGKIDHQIGREKDLSDSAAGALWNAVLHQATPGPSMVNVANAMLNVNRPRNINAQKLPSMFPGLYTNNKNNNRR